jgi:transposase InsO family protein
VVVVADQLGWPTASATTSAATRVARLTRLAGISGTVRRKHRTVTTETDRTAPRHPDLVRRGLQAPTAIDQLWVADFSYVWTLAGFIYVAFVVDVFSRRIRATNKHTGMVPDALRQVLQVRRRGGDAWAAAGLIHHSDAGSQCISVAFTAELLAAGITGPIGTVGGTYDCESVGCRQAA